MSPTTCTPTRLVAAARRGTRDGAAHAVENGQHVEIGAAKQGGRAATVKRHGVRASSRSASQQWLTAESRALWRRWGLVEKTCSVWHYDLSSTSCTQLATPCRRISGGVGLGRPASAHPQLQRNNASTLAVKWSRSRTTSSIARRPRPSPGAAASCLGLVHAS